MSGRHAGLGRPKRWRAAAAWFLVAVVALAAVTLVFKLLGGVPW